MSRAVSIHIGVNQPADRAYESALHSEDAAWMMAGLARQAGYQSIRVLLGQEATRQAVHDALGGASQMLRTGDILLVTYSGHGGQLRHAHAEDADGSDECWCLSDGHLLDNALAGYWRLFERGVRIVAVVESCFGGGMDRGNLYGPDAAPVDVQGLVAYRSRGTARSAESGAISKPSCTLMPPGNPNGIRASVLLFAAAHEHQRAQSKAFTGSLLEVWDNGAFKGDYVELYDRVRGKVLDETGREVQLLWLGAHDADFPLSRAFRPVPAATAPASSATLATPIPYTGPTKPAAPAAPTATAVPTGPTLRQPPDGMLIHGVPPGSVGRGANPNG